MGKLLLQPTLRALPVLHLCVIKSARCMDLFHLCHTKISEELWTSTKAQDPTSISSFCPILLSEDSTHHYSLLLAADNAHHHSLILAADSTHHDFLCQMKPAIDNKPPPKYVHLAQNLKKQQMDEERYSQIERDNYLLLDKMSYIMTHPQVIWQSVCTCTLDHTQRERDELLYYTSKNKCAIFDDLSSPHKYIVHHDTPSGDLIVYTYM